jgi:glycosyltransferase involved in cell wall biosynthesis
MKISIAIPVYNMPNKDFFLKRCLDSIKEQTFTDYEIVMTEQGGMAENTNNAIRACKGRFIKILYMDDFFAHKDALKEIAEILQYDTKWLVTGCDNDKGTGIHYPSYNNQIHTGYNTIGSPSVLTIANKEPLLFDETMTWLLDCDYYKRLHEKYGNPTVLNRVNVIIGVGDHQATNLMGEEIKNKEHEYMQKKYENNVR